MTQVMLDAFVCYKHTCTTKMIMHVNVECTVWICVMKNTIYICDMFEYACDEGDITCV